VFIHGLDSSKDTWSTVMDDLANDGYSSIALDLRGHGESPLGIEQDFIPRNVINDIHFTLSNTWSCNQFVLIGHSMGGRVVMRYAVEYPSSVLALIIEDMDIKPRENRNTFSEGELQHRREFSRKFPNFDSCIKSLETFGYENNRIKDWIKTGRIFQKPDQTVWSNINPFAQHLALKNIICSSDGMEAWNLLSQFNFHTHLYVAGQGSVCTIQGAGGVEDMKRILPSLEVSYFPEAGHSIHNSARKEFIKKIETIVDNVTPTV